MHKQSAAGAAIDSGAAPSGTLRFIAKRYTHIEELASESSYKVRFRLMANDGEERLIATCLTAESTTTDDPKIIAWKGNMKIQVKDEATDTLFYFEVFNETTDQIVSKG